MYAEAYGPLRGICEGSSDTIRVLLGQYTVKVILSPNFAKILAAFNNL